MFDSRYEVILADTSEARKIHYQLRYQVYCLEEGFEAHENFPNCMESDHWDQNSVHFIVRSKKSMEWIAAMRMVFPQGESCLPMESLCGIDSGIRPSSHDEDVVEISRICIKDTFRRKRQPVVGHAVDGTRSSMGEKAAARLQRYNKSEIMLGLFRAATVYSHEHNIGYWYFLTTSALARLLNHMNIQLIKIGSACLHRGKRFPYMTDLKESEMHLRRSCSVVEKMFSRYDLAYRFFSELHPGYDTLVA